METEKESKFSAECSWNCKGKDVASTISFGDYSEKHDEEEDLNHLVEVETCVFLTRPENSENVPCTLRIVSKDPSLQIKMISVVSEARIVELYGDFGEYLKTVKAETVDEVGEMFVNIAQTELSPVQELTFKFAGMKSGVNNMWLYGVHLSMKAGGGGGGPSGRARVDYRNVEERLRSAKVPITERAERCKKFLQQYTRITNSYQQGREGGADPRTLLRMLEEDCAARLKPLDSASRYLSSLLSAKRERRPPPPPSSSSPSPPAPPDLDADVKRYVDAGLRRLELDLTDHFDRRMRELEERQNKRLDSLLENR